MATASPETDLNGSLRHFVSEFLSFLERKEEKLLSWGFFDVSMSIDEITQLLNEASADLQRQYASLAKNGNTLEHIVDGMTYDGLLYRLPGESRFRTRFAEGTRLLARLRQWFPWQKNPGDARTLVSDIRIHLNARRFPIRDQTIDDCWEDLAALCAPASKALIHESFVALASRGHGTAFSFAQFQRRAFANIFAQYGTAGVSGSVVSAGTGSGKTKAFYVPAFLRIVEEIARREPASTKAVAIYPRNVLLADQLREALSEASKLKSVVSKFKLTRGITFGALLGDTPTDADFPRMLAGTGYRNWKRQANGFVLPYLKNPNRPDADLIWRDPDRSAGRTCLYAADRPNEEVIPDGVLRLTREQLQAHPPDVLFLSAEMLNREMGNPEWSRTFGIRQGERAPRLLLLDEVHAYSGIQGAQIAWLVRRWRHWTWGKKLHVVGLSATLRHASRHLGEVTGISEAEIQEFRPLQTELTEEGIEYNLAIKGDAFSGASLLATTIQAGMLLTRLLAPRHVPSVGEGEMHNNAFYGRKVFGFTDNLDTLNRWFQDMRDAEQKRLARLRHEPGNLPAEELHRRDMIGQVWRLCESLGHNLFQSLQVSGCSSQRPGVNAGSDLVIATSSLEVGYDDPEVGAILHHKRPSSLSSFVQRKGRAGRRRGMRPWTVLVLSDYGADRYAFQNAERLFQPEIDSIFLPIENPFVLRLQAAYFLLDWIGLKVRRGGPFQFLRPRTGGADASSVASTLDLLRGILSRGVAWNQFRGDFAKLFGSPRGPGVGSRLTDIQVDDILWNEPRPLLTEVVPTLVRKLERNWQIYAGSATIEIEDRNVTRPIPKLIPAATFGQLDVAEVEIRFPQQQDKTPEYLPLHQAIGEICPGRVSKRYSVGDKESAYWLSVSEALRLSDSQVVTLDARSCFPEIVAVDCIDGYSLYQPLAADLVQRPKEVLDSSNSFWRWKTHIRTRGSGQPLPIPATGIWAEAILSCKVFLHRDRSWAEVTRYAHEAEFVLRSSRDKKRGTLRCAIVEDGSEVPQAVGFRQSVDAICITVARHHVNSLAVPDGSVVDRMRVDYFRDRISNSSRLTRRSEGFVLENLATGSLAMLTATAIRNACSLSEAQNRLPNRVQAARRVFESIMAPRNGEQDDSQRNTANEVCAAWADPEVLETVTGFEACLWDDPSEDFCTWMRNRYIAALAQGFRTAAVSHVEDVSEDDLLVDVVRNPEEINIYISESSSGGVGQVERIVAEWRTAPERIPLGIDYALTHCQRQRTTRALRTTVDHVMANGSDDRVSLSFSAIRGARDFFELRAASEELKEALSESGLDGTRSAFVPLVSHLVRPGSSPESDRLTALLNSKLVSESSRLSIQIDPRVFAYACVQEPALRTEIAAMLNTLSGGTPPEEYQIFQTAEDLLWEGCEDSCRECLDDRNRYNDAGRPSRGLAKQWFSVGTHSLPYNESDEWLREVGALLLEHRTLTLVARDAECGAMMRKIQVLCAQEIEVEYLLVPISIAAVRRNGTTWHVILELRGVLHE